MSLEADATIEERYLIISAEVACKHRRGKAGGWRDNDDWWALPITFGWINAWTRWVLFVVKSTRALSHSAEDDPRPVSLWSICWRLRVRAWLVRHWIGIGLVWGGSGVVEAGLAVEAGEV